MVHAILNYLMNLFIFFENFDMWVIWYSVHQKFVMVENHCLFVILNIPKLLLQQQKYNKKLRGLHIL